MERLTEWRGEHAAVVNHHENYIDRLAAYEDTGLEPDIVKGLAMMCAVMMMEIDRLHHFEMLKKEGRLVVLPCKVGDTVWHTIHGEVVEDIITNIYVKYQGVFPFKDNLLGKLVFLTREEAEAALSGKPKCVHAIQSHTNEIGEFECYCELHARWMNVALGDCLGNCESEKATLKGE